MSLKVLKPAAAALVFKLALAPARAMAAVEAPGTEAPDLFTAGIKMVSSLLLLVGALLLILYLFRRLAAARNGTLGSHDVIHVIATRHLAPKNYITVVEIGDSVLTLGVTSENISCLDKTPADSFIKKAAPTTGQGAKGSFAHRLKVLTSQTPIFFKETKQQ
ncbi:MAG: flagellar biosynthetic protein FliO [Deltaproteobacteria bacterium]|nr:flagellar biosynthetic protein FliO [Deltaproteobacteria bacterium]MBW2087156.1 flagellar biosynthetic protein FliO [Deltaproteobacteria bacterium]